MISPACVHPSPPPFLPAGTYYGGRQVRDQVKQYLEQDTGILARMGIGSNARRSEVRSAVRLCVAFCATAWQMC